LFFFFFNSIILHAFYFSDQLGQIGANMSLALEQGLVCGTPNPSNMEQVISTF